jgi:transposase
MKIPAIEDSSKRSKKQNERIYARVIELCSEKGLSYRQAAQELQISKSTVGSYMRKWKTEISVSDIRPQGRQPILDNSGKQRIRCFLRKSPCATSRKIASELSRITSGKTSIQISPRTVRHNLRKMGFKNSFPLSVPAITDAQKEKRLEWCKKHQETDWTKVLFTDETMIDLYGGKRKIWHKRESRPKWGKKKYSRKRMFWAGLSREKITPLLPIFGTMNSDSYIALFREKVIPWMRRRGNRGLILQQDNAPPHVSRATKSYFSDERLDILDWPPNSPDLNPIENAWSFLKNRIETRSPKSLQELETIACEEWDQLPKTFLNNLIDSMPRRIAQVISRKCEKADY